MRIKYACPDCLSRDVVAVLVDGKEAYPQYPIYKDLGSMQSYIRFSCKSCCVSKILRAEGFISSLSEVQP